MEHILPEDRLIEYVKPYLKAKGFKKKNKRWTKETPDFTISFLIQGSFFSKENYYIRPGIFINALMPAEEYYGHWMLDIKPTTPEEIMMIFEAWCEEWTNKALIKERLLAFLEWEKQHTPEEIRALALNYNADPAPVYECFGMSPKTKQYILDNF